ncbi:1-deoxy-D-xylulose-5-phosphate synthase [Saccharicrinis fermentans]|uniref:1-deoxy-D-xylulose-5-phosphate synthase n=1 Tax=Saccharicrinis fermentans DSM 9555 = JCM 21142 TaxID=869213 RepID=W7Y5F5_9BACT|nr:1-deoxy-D-xylulose-5-phosphate synthase [Saccharicrinis fermentans]GAF02798.1 1-deoxy-D-xylulose-5-phosphate synthase [Saccharicrinis fermentans DSM 9555 = JCM 21142]
MKKGNSKLEQINTPDDLKKFSEKDLEQICAELRDFIIDAVSCNPGHFGASLGVVELTVALHYVYNTPYDKIIWDVGHQAYGHKILTARKNNFHTNRKYKGLSGFPNITESEYDAFGVGHSSTSISAALGMSIAAKANNEDDKHVVAVIGDGSMTAGLAFEGLNNLSSSKSNMLIILNDNNMAIDPNTGGLSDYLVDISTSQTYNKIRKEVIRGLEKLKITGPDSRHKIVAINNSIKSLLTKQTNIFEGLNIRYFGPVDGHDINHLVKVLQDLKNIPGPKVLHCKTKKGKGFKLAEENQTAWHATGAKFDKNTGEKLDHTSNKPKPPKYQEVFGHTIVELAEKNKKIMGITPAMPSGCSLNIMMEKMPDRAFDVGIAEQHAVTFSAGLAIEGMVPYCNIYSSFMQRAYDQVIHDVAIQNLNVVFCLDRGGLVGADGATHHGVYDLAFFRPVPNLIVSSPRNEEELRNLMYTAQLPNMGPFAIRYPRGTGTTTQWKTPFKKIEVGKGEKLKDGDDLAFITIGPLANKALQACHKLDDEGISTGLYDLRFAKPIDEKLLHEVFKKYKKIITVEDGTIIGGIGSAVIEFMVENGYSAQVKKLGVPDRFVDHGTQTELQHECGFDKQGMIETAKSMFQQP